MRKSSRLLINLLVICFISLSPAFAQDAEEVAVRETIQNYFQGHATGNGDYFRKAFHPEAGEMK